MFLAWSLRCLGDQVPRKVKGAVSAAPSRLQIEYWPISRLKPYEKNARKNDHVVDRIVQSLKEYGFAIPVLVKADGTVVDGHLRLKGAVKMGMSEVPVIVCNSWTDAQVRAFRLMANRSVTWAEWDLDALADEMKELALLDLDLSLTGFDESMIADLLPEAQNGSNESDRLKEQFQVLVICEDEYLQASLLERLNEEGFTCRALIS